MRSEEFEKWFARQVGVSREHVGLMWDGSTYYWVKHRWIALAWKSWNASRESVMKESIKNVKGDV